jgi:hypothetical protein
MRGFQSKQGVQPDMAYATCSDFCENFVADVQPLYLLAFLLTGSHTDAEQCLIATVDETLRANYVFKGWERPWSKRCLIINALRRVLPGPGENGEQREVRRAVDAGVREHSAINAVAGLAPPLQSELSL